MDQDILTAQQLWAEGVGLLERLEALAASLTRPWSAYQLGMILCILLVSSGVRRLVEPRVRAWLRRREGWAKWRFRLVMVPLTRLRLICAVLLLWALYAVMQELTWPSRSYLIGIAARLATAWLVIAIGTRLIGNPTLRSVFRYLAWGWATLVVLGLTAEAVALMDGMAVSFGSLRLSLWTVLQAVAVLILLFQGARFLSRVSSARIAQSQDISPSMRVLSIKLLQLVFYGAACFLGLRAVGVDLTGLAVLSGAIGVGLGFGLQKVVSNLVSGVILLLDKSIKPGDVISLGETFGWINTLGARYVSITTRDGKEYLIPNEDLITGQVVNWSHSNELVRLDVFFGTAYGDDPHRVRQIAIDAAASVPRVLADRAPVCHIVGFGDSSVDYILRFWICDPSAGLTNIRGNVYLALWDAFQAEGISIPFPQREVRMLDERGGAADPGH